MSVLGMYCRSEPVYDYQFLYTGIYCSFIIHYYNEFTRQNKRTFFSGDKRDKMTKETKTDKED